MEKDAAVIAYTLYTLTFIVWVLAVFIAANSLATGYTQSATPKLPLFIVVTQQSRFQSQTRRSVTSFICRRSVIEAVFRHNSVFKVTWLSLREALSWIRLGVVTRIKYTLECNIYCKKTNENFMKTLHSEIERQQ